MSEQVQEKEYTVTIRRKSEVYEDATVTVNAVDEEDAETRAFQEIQDLNTNWSTISNEELDSRVENIEEEK